MILLTILLSAIIIITLTIFIIGAVALPAFAVIFVIGLIFSIIAAVFKAILGMPLIVILIILGIIYFSKNKHY